MRKGGALKKEDKFKKNELLKITWIDAFTLPKGWLSSEEVEERMETPESIETVGFFYCQTNDYILLTQSIDSGEETILGMAIPLGVIKEIKRLK